MTDGNDSNAKAESAFWRAVRELAAMRKYIPEERRVLSGVRRLFAEELRPARAEEA